MRKSRGRQGAAAAAVATVLAALPWAGTAAGAQTQGQRDQSPFAEPDVRVLHTLRGQPGSYFGWAISELGSRRAPGGGDLIVGERWGDGGSDVAGGAATVFEGRSGRVRFRYVGQPGDQAGFAVADAGDVNRDGRADVLVGAPGVGAGHVDLVSGRTGRLLRRFAGEDDGDFFGAAVAGVGDVDRDGRPDVLVGAPRHGDSGRAYLLSGRTGATLLTLDGEAAGDAFGSATDGTGTSTATAGRTW
ncbi:MAG: integrin alpha [Nocardioides sp.]